MDIKKQHLELSNVAGLSTMVIDNFSNEIAINGTDISFTLIHDHNKHTRLFKDLLVGDLVWVVVLNDRATTMKWIGDSDNFLKNSTLAVKKIIATFKKEKRDGNLTIAFCKIISVYDENSGVIEFVNSDPSKCDRHYMFLNDTGELELESV